MSKKNSSKKVEKVEDKQSYRNPIETIWGKVLVWFLIVGMVGVVIVGVIMAIYEALK